MAHRMRFTSSTGFTEARRELAAEVRDLADRLDSQEPDHSASHDAWEVLVELAEQAEVCALTSSAGIPSRRLGD
jgi:hypothetical protein